MEHSGRNEAMTGDSKHPVEPAKELRPALFLDRDGVINVDDGYVYQIEKFTFLPSILDAIKRFNERNWRVFVVTNQSGIARGYYTENDMFKLHMHMTAEMAAYGAKVDAIYHCPYHAEGEISRYRVDSELRKPKPGMLLQAMEEHPTNKALSFMIGDKTTDIQAAEAAGIHGFLYRGGDIDAFIEGAYHTMISQYS